MQAVIPKSDKRKTLLALREKLLEDIKYYEKRIEQDTSIDKTSYFEDDDSSDSEIELSIVDSGRSILQLKNKKNTLMTCEQATLELTGLELLQHEINVVVSEPTVNGISPAKEPGLWREVTAECCVDLVPFSINFYVHQPDRKFAQKTYHGLRVVPLKTPHEVELAYSILPTLKRPNDAVEVLRSYAAAYRSRRSTLAKLADKFGSALHMEPMPDGGYLLKCANLLELSWTLLNNWSPIALFHHNLNIDLEYMEEQYIKTISQAHRQLSDPALVTDERTLLLATIVTTCLEASGGASETEIVREREVMAPPKAIPKRVKPKGKENTDNNKNLRKPVKRSMADDSDKHGVKKIKPIENITENSNNMAENMNKKDRSVASDKNTKKCDAAGSKQKHNSVAIDRNDEIGEIVAEDSQNSDTSAKNIQKSSASVRNSMPQIDSVNNIDSQKSDDHGRKIHPKPKNNIANTKNCVANTKNHVANSKSDVANTKNYVASTKKRISAETLKTTTKPSKSNEQIKNITESGKSVATNNVRNTAEKLKSSSKTVVSNEHSVNATNIAKTNNEKRNDVASAKNSQQKQSHTGTNAANTKNNEQKSEQRKTTGTTKNIAKTNNEKRNDVANTKKNEQQNEQRKTTETLKNNEKNDVANANKSQPKQLNTGLNVANAKTNEQLKNKVETQSIKKVVKSVNYKIAKPINTPKITKQTTTNVKNITSGNTRKENGLLLKTSKIPQKKASVTKVTKKFSPRMSPRNCASKPGTSGIGKPVTKPVINIGNSVSKPGPSGIGKPVTKPATNIPGKVTKQNLSSSTSSVSKAVTNIPKLLNKPNTKKIS